jgi:hypothetical protein
MQECTPLCDHLDEFNKILMNLKNIDIQVDYEKKDLICCVHYVSSLISLIQCCTVEILSLYQTLSLL